MMNSIIMDYQEKHESVQYNAVLAITSAIRGTSSKKLSQELDLGSLKSRTWPRRICYFQKALSRKLPIYLYKLAAPILKSHRNAGCYRVLYCRTDAFRSSIGNYRGRAKTRNKGWRDEWRTIEKIKVSLAISSSANKGHRIESCGTPALICNQFKV